MIKRGQTNIKHCKTTQALGAKMIKITY